LLVHLIARGAIAPRAGTVGALLRELRSAPEVAVPGLVAWVGRLPETARAFWNRKHASSDLLPDWDHPMHELAGQALLRDEAGFVAAPATWRQANLRLGAHFLLGVSGHPVPAAIAADVVHAIATREAGAPPFPPAVLVREARRVDGVEHPQPRRGARGRPALRRRRGSGRSARRCSAARGAASATCPWPCSPASRSPR
jgi:hypothetical protein